MPSLQVRALGFGFLQDGNVGVGVIPKHQDVLAGCYRFGGVAGESIHAPFGEFTTVQLKGGVQMVAATPSLVGLKGMSLHKPETKETNLRPLHRPSQPRVLRLDIVVVLAMTNILSTGFEHLVGGVRPWLVVLDPSAPGDRERTERAATCTGRVSFDPARKDRR